MEENSLEIALCQRVRELIYKEGVSVTSYAKSIGMAQATLNQQLVKHNLQANTLLAILKTYPDVSAEWLMRGNETHITSSEKSIEELKEELARKNKHIDFLYGIAQDFKERLDKLTK